MNINAQCAYVLGTGSSNRCSFRIPLAEYLAMMSLCDRSTPEYEYFINGIIVDQTVHFLFNESTSQNLYRYALATYPAAALHIQKTMREAGDEFPL